MEDYYNFVKKVIGFAKPPERNLNNEAIAISKKGPEEQKSFWNDPVWIDFLRSEGQVRHKSRILEHILTIHKYGWFKSAKPIIKSGSKILHLFSAEGDISEYLSIVCGANVIGIDYSKTMLQEADRIKKKLGNNKVIFLNQELSGGAKIRDKFDVVFSFTSMPISNLDRLLKSVKEVLNDGGYLIWVTSGYVQTNKVGFSANEVRFGYIDCLWEDDSFVLFFKKNYEDTNKEYNPPTALTEHI